MELPSLPPLPLRLMISVFVTVPVHVGHVWLALP